jgi:hypothetical protein
MSFCRNYCKRNICDNSRCIWWTIYWVDREIIQAKVQIDRQPSNELSQVIHDKAWLQVESCVAITSLCQNSAERAIRTFKNNFISGLCLTDTTWPVQLGDHLAMQVVITVHLLHASYVNTCKSAYHQLYDHTYDWNEHLMMPPGSRGIIYEDSTNRDLWSTCDMDAWYIVPALDHYMIFNWFVPETDGLCVSRSFDLFSQHWLVPGFTPDQNTYKVHDELCNSKKNLLKKLKTALQ